MKDSSIFSAFSEFESGKLTSERRHVPFRRFHGKSGISGPSILFVKHQRCLGAFLKVPEIKGAFHKARLQRVLINFFFEFWNILKFVAYRNMRFKGARNSVHTLKAFSTFQMVSSTYLYIKMHFFESNRPTNQKGAMGTWEYPISVQQVVACSYLV